MYCPKCDTTYSTTKTIINLRGLPVDERVEIKFCPVCGYSTQPKTEILETNIFDQVERYSHCIVEVLSNSITGEISVGWYKTNETKELGEIINDNCE